MKQLYKAPALRDASCFFCCKFISCETSQDDRIQLYRAYFPVTFAEMQHPPSYGLQVFGAVFWVIAAAFPLYWLVKRFMLNPAPYQLHPDYMVSFSSGVAAVS